ncbi:MAG: helix-turn-helix domain-containing protein [Dehalococcoidia bacterium]
MTTWHQMLREARERRGLSQRDLATRAQVGLKTVNNHERGTRKFSRDMLLKLAAALELDRQETNVLLTDAGFDPVPTGLLARFEQRSPPLTSMRREIDQYP